MTGLLHLVRHGETTANVARMLDTLPPGAPLTPEGIGQARKFAAERPQVPGAPPIVLSSVARRAQQTAGLIAAGWDTQYTVLDDVHEVQAGELEGLADDDSVQQFRDVVKRWYLGDLSAAVRGGESADALLSRYLPVIDGVQARHLEDSDVYLVSHGAAIRLIAARLAGVDGEYAHRHPLPNTGEIVLRPDRGSWSLVDWANAPAPGSPAPADDPMG